MDRLCTWLRFDQNVVGKGGYFDGEAEERAQGGVAGLSSVEAKDELVEVGLQMFAAQPVVDAARPALEVGEDLVDPGKDEMSGGLADDLDVVNCISNRSIILKIHLNRKLLYPIMPDWRVSPRV